MTCTHGTRERHDDSQLWAGVQAYAGRTQAAQLARAQQLAWRSVQYRSPGPMDVMVPRTTVIELDDGRTLHGGPDWPAWVEERVGRAPMWVTDHVDDSTAELLVSLFPTTGLWPVRLLEDTGERWALIPAQRPADVPARLCWRIPGRGRETGVSLSALLRSWEDRIGAELVAIGRDTVELHMRSGTRPNWVLCWDSDGRPAPQRRRVTE